MGATPYRPWVRSSTSHRELRPTQAAAAVPMTTQQMAQWCQTQNRPICADSAVGRNLASSRRPAEPSHRRRRNRVCKNSAHVSHSKLFLLRTTYIEACYSLCLVGLCVLLKHRTNSRRKRHLANKAHSWCLTVAANIPFCQFNCKYAEIIFRTRTTVLKNLNKLWTKLIFLNFKMF